MSLLAALLRRAGPWVTSWSSRTRWRVAVVAEVVLRPLMRSRWRIARRNLALCFPEATPAWRAALLAAHRRRLLFGATELLQAWYATPAQLRGLATLEGREHLDAARAAGEGVLLFTGHFLQTELLARLLREATGHPVGGVVRRHNNPALEAELRRVREGIGPILDKFDTRGLVRTLRGGGWVVYSADQDFNRHHAFVPFFGVPAATLVSPPQIAAAGKAQVLLLSGLCDAEGRYRIRIEPVWPSWGSETPEAYAASYMRQLERWIGEAPEQYLWVHRRFKTRPPGAPGVY
jgi:KDO2-lipid IV(A) lauroyltransferase